MSRLHVRNCLLIRANPIQTDHSYDIQFSMYNLHAVLLSAYKEQIYKAFREYQPSWDDDGLSDVLSYCDEGIIEEYGKPDEFAKNLVDELDHLWCCHYRPHLYSLEEQYREAIA